MTLLHLNPANCRPFIANPRHAAALTPETCGDLIESIRTDGQQIPAIVRPLHKGRWHYEVVCGMRRHFAVQHLRAAGHDLPFIAEARNLSDAEAFRLGDLENRNRSDVCDYERALSYAHALDRFYGGSQKDMAGALGVSRSWLSRYLLIGRLPEDIVAAFPAPSAIRASHARRIAKCLADESRRDGVLLKAKMMRRTPDRSVADVMTGLEAVGAPEVLAKRKAKLRRFRNSPFCPYVTLRKQKDRAVVEFPTNITPQALRGALEAMLEAQAWRT